MVNKNISFYGIRIKSLPLMFGMWIMYHHKRYIYIRTHLHMCIYLILSMAIIY